MREMPMQDSMSVAGEKRRRRRGAKGRTQAGERNENGSVTDDITSVVGSAAGAAKPTHQKRKRDKVQTNQSNGCTTSTESSSHDGVDSNTNDDTSSCTNNKRNKRKRTKSKPPQPGEEGYLTKTQLRNAAKRKAKKLKKMQQQSSNTETPGADGEAGSSSSSRRGKSKRTRSKMQRDSDPSTRYIDNPKSAPLVNKAKKFFNGLNIPFEIHLGDLKGWRTVCKLPARRANNEEKSCIIGLFRPGSHSIVAVPKCIAHHPSINNAINILQKECDEMGIQPYDESEGKGDLRYVCINVERRTGKVQVTLVWNSHPFNDNDNNSHGKHQLLEKFTKHLISKSDSLKMHSLWVHFNAQWKHASNIFDYGHGSSSQDTGNLWKHIHGPKFIIEKLDLGKDFSPREQQQEVSLHFPPNVFRQANLDAFTKIVIAIRKYLTEYNASREGRQTLPTCLELYGGVGTIGLNVVDLVSAFTSSDENPYNKECFEKSANLLSNMDDKDNNNKNNRSKCKYIPKNATDVIREDNVLSNNCEVVIVDPPRKGLDDYVVQSFIDSAASQGEGGPELLVYVSCGFDAFVRDCDKLLGSKRWKLVQGEGHLLFPGSDAIETLAFFHRQRIED